MIPEIEAKELITRIKNGEKLTIIDVRTQQEWNQTGVVKESELISMDTIANELENGYFKNKAEPIYILCRSGARSGRVTEYMRGNYKLDAINIKGGIISWKNQGGELLK